MLNFNFFKIIGLTYEICDARLAEIETKKDLNYKLSKRIIPIPSTFQAFNYLYSFTGLFTGNFIF